MASIEPEFTEFTATASIEADQYDISMEAVVMNSSPLFGLLTIANTVFSRSI